MNRTSPARVRQLPATQPQLRLAGVRCVLVIAAVTASTHKAPVLAQTTHQTPVETVTSPPIETPPSTTLDTTPTPVAAPDLFDGKTLEGWRVIEKFDFDGHGEVSVKDGAIYLERGQPATGISWKGRFPRSNYQLNWTAQRVSGNDFFCGLTFPVKDEYCSLILGGWGGSIVGLSNIDGFSAVENTTTQAIDFEQGRWYKFQLTVLDDRITITMDDRPLIKVDTAGHRFSIWWEQEPVTPLGIVTWNTTGAIKDLEVKRVAIEPPGQR